MTISDILEQLTDHGRLHALPNAALAIDEVLQFPGILQHGYFPARKADAERALHMQHQRDVPKGVPPRYVHGTRGTRDRQSFVVEDMPKDLGELR